MNREEIKKKIMCLIEDKGSHELDMNANDCFTMDGINIFYIGDEITDIIIKHEQDTLKEFVEYLKAKIEDKQNILFWENENMYAINVGICISMALENFIKERGEL